MDFLDRTRLRIRSGSGGTGCVSFRREKNVQFGGPDGGDGGRGGDLWAKAIPGMTTLASLRRVRLVHAGNGVRGLGGNRTGASGADRVLEVPAGTILFDEGSGTVIADLAIPGDRILLARGGAGGMGNARFATSTNRTPRKSTPGEAGVEYDLGMQLKLLADAGIVGLPNAGKSTFLRAASNARPKVADYPFTTLTPFLGTVFIDHDAFVLADIPGLIAGAHCGAGLGDQFLGHIERCAVLLHLIDCTSDDVVRDYATVMDELVAYGAELANKPRLIRLSKVDALTGEETERKLEYFRTATGNSIEPVSAVSGERVQPTLRALWKTIESTRSCQA